MFHTLPELKRLRRGDIARFGTEGGAALEWTVLYSGGDRLLLLCRQELKADWLAQRGGNVPERELNRIIAEQWRPEWFDWMEIELVCDGPARKYLPGESGVRPLVELDLSVMEYHPKEEKNMLALDTVEQLVRHGMDERTARRLVRLGELPPQLVVPQHTNNLELLARHMDLNDDRCKFGLLSFLDRDFAINQRMEVIPQWFDFPEEDAQAYLSRPLDWRRDIYDWVYAEEALKLITPDKALIHSVLVHMFCYGAYVSTDEFCSICRKLAEVNTDPAQMDRLLGEYSYHLFSDYADTAGCIDQLAKISGRENVLAALLADPLLPRKAKDAARIARIVFDRKTSESDSAEGMRPTPFS